MSGAGQSGALVAVEHTAAGVAVVRLDNPPVNSMSDPLLDALDAAVRGLDQGATRALVLTGTGEKAFAAGADLPTFRAVIEDEEEIRAHVGRTRGVLELLSSRPYPTVAALQASAMGGGLELTLACDLAIADAKARIGLPEVNLGLIPGAGGTQRLARRVGRMRATEMILTGRALRAGEALEIGLVSAVAEQGQALATALELADDLAAKPPLAVAAALRAIRGGFEGSLADGLDLEREAFLGVLASRDAREGIDAFMERRPAQFEGR